MALPENDTTDPTDSTMGADARKTGKTPSSDTPAHTNRLAKEKSPYLRQHAHNPVDWYPWGEAAFAAAKTQNKPIFLSIGYSTCHWCHVMERESFESEEVAAHLNRVFIPIKVDREERPDIDHVYMQVAQMLTGRGGWPLTILMTPEREPFFAATYIPPRGAHGRMGLVELTQRTEQAWKERREEIDRSAEQIVEGLRRLSEGGRPEAAMAFAPETDAEGGAPSSFARAAFEALRSRFDEGHGGFGDAPKFPTPHNLYFLLRHGRAAPRKADREAATAMALATLRAMRAGGVFDHVGLGMHRYSTDRRWLLPHFEKMLYDQALVSLAATEAYQATGEADLRAFAEAILAYTLHDLRAPGGAFYSAEDADSEGEEGKFYLWTEAELVEALGVEEGAFAARLWGVEARGNFEDEATGRRTGANVLHWPVPLETFVKREGMTRAALDGRLEALRAKLFAARAKRVRPHLDDKILTDWNGLQIAALARAGVVFDEPRYTAAAVEAYEFLHRNLRDEGGAWRHRWREGEAAIPAILDDHAFLAWGLLELYAATLEPRYLADAIAHGRILLEDFRDPATGAFYMTADHAEDLLIRPKEFYDGAIPSGNSAAYAVLHRLGRLTGDPDWESAAARLASAYDPWLRQAPTAFTHFLAGSLDAGGPGREVVVVGPRDGADTKALIAVARAGFRPDVALLWKPPAKAADSGPKGAAHGGARDGGARDGGSGKAGQGEATTLAHVAPFTEGMTGVANKDGGADTHGAGVQATAYLCEGRTCRPPITDPAALAAALAESDLAE